MTGIVIDFNISYFRSAFREFANENAFSNAMLQMYWDWATYYVSSINVGPLFNLANPPNSLPPNSPAGFARSNAINLMTAHLLEIYVIGTRGELPGILTEATIDKVNIQLEPPPLPNQWQYWLNTTRYGQQLLALLQIKSAGGFYSGGIPVLGSFR